MNFLGIGEVKTFVSVMSVGAGPKHAVGELGSQELRAKEIQESEWVRFADPHGGLSPERL